MSTMARSRRPSTSTCLFAAAVSLVLLLAAAPGPAPASSADAADARSTTSGDAVERWIGRHARAVEIAPDAPDRDLRWLDRVVADARLVGLGESTHGSSEQFQVKHRLVRRLVEHHGFRTIAFEDDFGSGVLIDRYLTTGQGDPRQLVDNMAFPLWGTEEVLDLVTWLRDWNQSHKSKVRFLGTDLLQPRQWSFDEIISYVRAHAPAMLSELNAAFGTIRPTAGQNPYRWYREHPQKQSLIPTAERVVALVEDVNGPDRWQREYAEQHARAILGWFRNLTEGESVFRPHRERFIADSLRWWQQLAGHPKTVYWAANAHTAATYQATVRTPDQEQPGTWAGGILERRYGKRYVSIGTWFGAGQISSPAWFPVPPPQPIGAPRPGMLEATLHAARPASFAIDLRKTRGPAAVRDWLDDTHTMRMILPEYDASHDGNDYSMTVDGLRDAFDAAIYLPVTSASRTY